VGGGVGGAELLLNVAKVVVGHPTLYVMQQYSSFAGLNTSRVLQSKGSVLDVPGQRSQSKRGNKHKRLNKQHPVMMQVKSRLERN